jgi:hypothetical protein
MCAAVPKLYGCRKASEIRVPTASERCSKGLTDVTDQDADSTQVCCRNRNTTTIPLLCHFASPQQHEGHSDPSPEGQLLLSRRRRRRERGRRRGPVHTVESKGGGGPVRRQSRRRNYDASPPRP